MKNKMKQATLKESWQKQPGAEGWQLRDTGHILSLRKLKRALDMC